MVRLWSLVLGLIVRTFLVVKMHARLKMAEDRRMFQIIRINGIVDQVAVLPQVAQVVVKSMSVRAVMHIPSMVDISWLHLKNEVSARYVSILRVKDTAVALKSASNLVPASLIELVEVISPGKVESILFVPVINLNIVEKKIPWHINRVQTSAPCVEGGCPEVHSQGLLLVHEVNCVVVVSIKSADNITVDSELDVIGGPFHLISMPVIIDVVIVGIFVAFFFIVTIAVDGVD